MRKIYCLVVVFTMLLFKMQGQVSTAAPVPTKNASDVISIYSNTYTNLTGTVFNPAWSQATVVADTTIATNAAKKYTNWNYSGITFSPNINASSMANLHLDIYPTNCTKIDIYLIPSTGAANQKKVTKTLTQGSWNSIDIPLTDYTSQGLSLSAIMQAMFTSITPASGAKMYVDNIYFWKSATTPSITGFTVPAKIVTDLPFNLTNPTSNSTGAFTYTSSNANVATISGSTVTIKGVGSTTITATQAAAGSYLTGTTMADLFVSPAAAPIPTKAASDVLSLFSGAYTDVAGTDWNPFWGQATSYADISIGGNATKRYNNLNFQGVNFSTPLNASSMTYLHLDAWSADCTELNVFLINLVGTVATEKSVTLALTPSSWGTGFDIALSQFTGIALSSLNQLKFEAKTPATGASVFMDNLYFWKSANSPTITGFSVPAKTIGDADFDLTKPTSNSTGAFTYTSSNTAVATISGTKVSIKGAGTSVITATQAAAGSYIAGSTSANLVVIGVPTKAAPTPTTPSANVISIYSNAYNNVKVDTFKTVWSVATMDDILLENNATKKYSALDFVGIEASGANVINAATMLYFHVDVWTPNVTSFKIKLVDFGTNGIYGGGDDALQELIFAPSVNGWNSYDIALADFTGLTTKSHIGQLIFSALPTAAGTVYIDNIYFHNASNVPSIAAPIPTLASAKVLSMFSNTYTNVGVDTWKTSWTAPSVTLQDLQIAGNDTKLYNNLDFVGIETIGANLINAAAMNYFHVDVWTPNIDSFKIKLVDIGADGVFGGTDDKEYQLAFKPLLRTWNSYSIALTDFVGLTTKNHIAQLIFSATPTGTATAYIDNVYFSTSALPVALSSFTAAKNNHTTVLNWKTELEQNNSGFNVERSNNGKDWTALEFVKGNGTSSKAHFYAATDKSPLAGINYYRLQQVDLDGKFKYSTVEVVNFKVTNPLTLSFYPNPAKERLMVSVPVINNSTAKLTLVNAAGATVKTAVILKANAASSIPFPTANLAKGVYFLTLKDGNAITNSKVVID